MSTPAYDLSKEEEVKKYVENIGIEYRFECYSEKKPDGCHRLGDYMESLKRDFAKAAKIYKQACEKYEYGKSCHKYANYLLLGKGGVEKDPVDALSYYKRGCESKCKESCYQIGSLFTTTKHGLCLDHTSGLKYYERACDLDDSEGCYSASGIYLTGAPGVQKNMTKAFVASMKSCELGNVYACANVSMMYDKGSGVAKDEEQAKIFKEKTLDMQKQATEHQVQISFGEGRK